MKLSLEISRENTRTNIALERTYANQLIAENYCDR